MEKLTTVKTDAASKAAFTVLDAIQLQPPGVRVMGAAVALIGMAKNLGIEPVRALRYAANLYDEAMSTGDERITALADFTRQSK